MYSIQYTTVTSQWRAVGQQRAVSNRRVTVLRVSVRPKPSTRTEGRTGTPRSAV